MHGRAGALATVAVLLAAGMAGCIGDSDPSLDQLAADSGIVVDVSPGEGDVDTTFTFDASETPNADALTFTWAFGDGANATGDVVEHSFAWTNHVYEVTVTASNGTATLERTVEVPVGSGDNADPTVAVDADKRWVAHGEALNLNATVDDADGDPVTVSWLVAEKQESGGHGHDHDHGHGGGGADEGDPYGIPEDTGKTGESATFRFNESATYRLVAQAEDPKDGRARDTVEVKVTRTVPKTTFTFQESNTLAAGTASGETGVSASEILYDAQEPSQNTYVDAARYDTRLVYPGSGTFSLDWSNSTAPADLEASLVDQADNEVAHLATEDPQASQLSTEVDLSDGSYTILVRANAGAEVPYTVTLDLDLDIPGLTDTPDEGGDGHDDHDH